MMRNSVDFELVLLGGLGCWEGADSRANWTPVPLAACPTLRLAAQHEFHSSSQFLREFRLNLKLVSSQMNKS